MYSAKLEYGVPPPEILPAGAHSGDLGTEELLCTDGQAVDEVAKALQIRKSRGHCSSQFPALGESKILHGYLPDPLATSGRGWIFGFRRVISREHRGAVEIHCLSLTGVQGSILMGEGSGCEVAKAGPW